ncbi:MAG: hypothetical protein WAV51_03135 [Microgenomates group bacterium]
MKTLHLTIDSRDAKKTNITVVGNGYTESLVNEEMTSHSQVILPFIDLALKKHGDSVSDIQDITVLVDQGSFTGRRVGVTIAQTLGYLLNIPVNGNSANEPIEIPYEQDKWK